jgi:hypothetical protein
MAAGSRQIGSSDLFKKAIIAEDRFISRWQGEAFGLEIGGLET